MSSYSQRDLRWSNVKIGGTNLTIGRFGCLITCIADLSTYFGNGLTPDQIAARCQFNADGLLIWKSFNFENFILVERAHTRDDAKIARAVKDPLTAVALEVANASHWVVGVEVYPNNGLVKIADPWLGDWASMNRYQDNITGAAYFKRI